MCVQSDDNGGGDPHRFIKAIYKAAVAEPELHKDAFDEACAAFREIGGHDRVLPLTVRGSVERIIRTYLRHAAPKPFVPGHYSLRWAHGFQDIHYFATDAEWPTIRQNGHVIGERVEPKF